jgi:hypothetical protein
VRVRPQIREKHRCIDSDVRAFMIRVKASSQNAQVLGFIRLGLRPTTRKGIAKGPRKTTGKRSFCQHPLQMVECCRRSIESLQQAPIVSDELMLQTRGLLIYVGSFVAS